jgi:hypothetical protein
MELQLVRTIKNGRAKDAAWHPASGRFQSVEQGNIGEATNV